MRDAGAVVSHDDPDLRLLRRQARLDLHLARHGGYRLNGVRQDVQQGMVQTVRVEGDFRQVLLEPRRKGDAFLRRRRLRQFHHFPHDGVDAGPDSVRRRLAAVGKHVEDELVDAGEVSADDVPARRDGLEVLSFQTRLDGAGAALNALENVLDVVGQAGDGLADGREALLLDLARHEAGVLDRQARLATDRRHQFQVLGGKLALADVRVHVDDSEDLIAAADGDADSAADAVILDALALLESLVLHGVGREDTLPTFRHVVDDGPADADGTGLGSGHGGGCADGRFTACIGAGLFAPNLLQQFLAPPDRPRHHRPRPLVPQQNEPAVGIHNVEHHVENVRQKPIHVEPVGQHLRNAIKRPQADDAGAHPGHVFAAGEREVRLSAGGFRADDARVDAPLAVHANRQTAMVHQGAFGHRSADRQDRVAHADLVARVNGRFVDANAVDVRTVRRTGVFQHIHPATRLQAGVVPTDTRIVEIDVARRIPANEHTGAVHLKRLAAIRTLDDR